MRRRDLITLLGGAAVWPVAARAQGAPPVIGYLYSGAAETGAHLLSGFRQGLSELGFVEGRNVAIEYRWAENQPARLPELAADLVRRRVAVIATLGSPGSVLAAKAATTTIPIVFRSGTDPVESGFVTSLNRPGGNVTGVTSLSWETGAKRLGLLHELLPGATRFVVLLNQAEANVALLVKDMQAGAATLGIDLQILGAASSREIESAFAALAHKRPDALLIAPHGLFTNRRVQVVTLVARHGLPAMYPTRDYVEIGGLMSYGANAPDQFRQAGIYTGRVLKGEKPADLPVLRASKFELAINLPTARAFGIEVPTTLLARADEVIE
jgi:putative tryptophan/tyrosine transport system substrate-binding protein